MHCLDPILILAIGLIEPPSEEALRRERMQRRHMEWLQEQRRLQAQLERERQEERERRRRENASGKRGGYEQERERERREEEARYQEMRRQRELEYMMKDYCPQVELTYTDQYGNELNPKEASRQRIV
jgi:U4/U6.U5 tri-snRNP-associated protein 1